MTKEKVRRILNTQNQNFYFVISALKEYFMTEPVRSTMLNHIVLAAKNKKNFTIIDLISFFYDFGKSVVSNTVFCRTLYAEKMLMKTVWENARILDIVIRLIKDNYKTFIISEESLEELKAQEKELRLKNQAELMRQAKAQKRLEKKNEEQQQNKKMQEPVKSKDKFSKEELAQIELLKHVSS